MIAVYLSLGSNLGKRRAQLENAARRLEELLGAPLACSKIYETAAWGKSDQPSFLNQVIAFSLEPGDETWLLEQIHVIETGLGRVRTEKWGKRLIDIDILLAGEQVVQTGQLTIPHPYLQHRRFVLVPLCEIAPELRHPLLQYSMQELLAICTDPLQVQVIGENTPG